MAADTVEGLPARVPMTGVRWKPAKALICVTTGPHRGSPVW